MRLTFQQEYLLAACESGHPVLLCESMAEIIMPMVVAGLLELVTTNAASMVWIPKVTTLGLVVSRDKNMLYPRRAVSELNN